MTTRVRDDTWAVAVADRGAKPAVVDLYDRAAVVNVLSHTDGAVHTASPGDATSVDLDSAGVDAWIEGFEGTGKAYVQISGLWIYGSNTSIGRTPPSMRPH